MLFFFFFFFFFFHLCFSLTVRIEKTSENFVMVSEIWKILDKLGKIRKLMSGNPELISYTYR